MESSYPPWLSIRTSRRKAAIRLGLSYAAALTSAHLLAAGAVSLMIVSLTRNRGGDLGILSSRKNLIAVCGLVAISATVGGVAGVLNMVPSFRWFADGAEPTPGASRGVV
ncbi:hypothetical protein [Mycobacterium avium]|uniref:hypothetical protein n=1 Tax=Mycobacterium avium TaxID=1764 RepID=UPI0015E22230|nr:hypothetical protein [Mycobacterium avium]